MCPCSLQPLKPLGLHLFSKVAHHERVGLVLVTEVGDSDAACTYDLAWEPILVDLAEPSPFTKLLVVRNVNQGYTFLRAETLDEFLVRRFVARLGEHHHLSLTCIQSLCNFMEPTNGTINLEGVTQNALACSHQICALLLDFDLGHDFCFVVRHSD